jgi:cell division transport system permease protein
MRGQFVLSEIAIGLRRNLTMTIAVVLTTTISLALLGSGLLISKQVTTMKGYWYDKVEVSLFLCTGNGVQCPNSGQTTDAQRQELKKELLADPIVQTVYYENQHDAYIRFKELFKDQPDLVSATTEQDIQDSYRVKLKDPKQGDVLSDEFKDKPGVSSIVDARKQFGALFQVLNVFQKTALIVALLSIVAAILLISNTIRVAAFNRRRETGIMRLVGASNFYIQLPFLLEGALAGLLGAILACSGLGLFQWLVIDKLLRQRIQTVHFIGWDAVWATVPKLVIVGVVLSGSASFVTLRRYLRV